MHLTLSILFLKDVDECVNHTCQNGGSCKDGVNNYSCNCLPGFMGDRCQTGRYFNLFFHFLPCFFRVTIIAVIVVVVVVISVVFFCLLLLLLLFSWSFVCRGKLVCC